MAGKINSGGLKIPAGNKSPSHTSSKYPGGVPPQGAPALKDVMNGGTVKK